MSGKWQYTPIEQQGARGRLWYDFGSGVTALLWLGRMKVTGRENIPTEGPFILAPNHVSYADPPVAGAGCRRVRRLCYMAKAELFRIPVMRSLIRSWAFPVHRGSADREAIRTSLRVLQSGGGLVMFPEGGRAPNGKALLPGELGVAMVAARAGNVPVIPCGLVGLDRCWPHGRPFPIPFPIEVRYGKPLDLPMLGGERVRKPQFEEATHVIMGAIAELLDRPNPGVAGTDSAVWPEGVTPGSVGVRPGHPKGGAT
jgi:1-acyl-sn-glycerol-3-phosphate acyltransferase